MDEKAQLPLERLDACRWRIPRDARPGMRVDGIIYADERLMEHLRGEQAAEQVANVATLPGIVGASLAMPDIHWGYGFCIGGVAAMDVEADVYLLACCPLALDFYARDRSNLDAQRHPRPGSFYLLLA